MPKLTPSTGAAMEVPGVDASQAFFRTPEARVIYSDRVTIRAIAARRLRFVYFVDWFFDPTSPCAQ